MHGGGRGHGQPNLSALKDTLRYRRCFGPTGLESGPENDGMIRGGYQRLGEFDERPVHRSECRGELLPSRHHLDQAVRVAQKLGVFLLALLRGDLGTIGVVLEKATCELLILEFPPRATDELEAEDLCKRSQKPTGAPVSRPSRLLRVTTRCRRF